MTICQTVCWQERRVKFKMSVIQGSTRTQYSHSNNDVTEDGHITGLYEGMNFIIAQDKQWLQRVCSMSLQGQMQSWNKPGCLVRTFDFCWKGGGGRNEVEVFSFQNILKVKKPRTFQSEFGAKKKSKENSDGSAGPHGCKRRPPNTQSKQY